MQKACQYCNKLEYMMVEAEHVQEAQEAQQGIQCTANVVSKKNVYI
jgi:hypothetical protein